MIRNLTIQQRLHLLIRMHIFDSRQRINVRLGLCLNEAAFHFLLLPNLLINIIKPNNQTEALFFLDHRGYHLDMQRLAVHHDAVTPCEDTASFNFCQHILFREGGEETIQILWMCVNTGILPH